MRSQFGIDDIVKIDLAQDSMTQSDLALTDAEVVVCADVIEHVNNVGEMM